MNESVSYVTDGTYNGNALVIIERRGGISKHIWHGFFDGYNLVKMYPKYPWGVTDWDGIKRQPMTLSIREIERI